MLPQLHRAVGRRLWGEAQGTACFFSPKTRTGCGSKVNSRVRIPILGFGTIVEFSDTLDS